MRRGAEVCRIEHVIEHVRCLYASTIDATYLLHTCPMVYNIVYIPAPAAPSVSLFIHSTPIYQSSSSDSFASAV